MDKSSLKYEFMVFNLIKYIITNVTVDDVFMETTPVLDWESPISASEQDFEPFFHPGQVC